MEERPSRATIRETYNVIGDHFAETRNRPWTQVTDFLADAGHHECGIDIGCGNGRHLPFLEDTCSITIGIDVSRVLLGHASKNVTPNTSLIEGEASALPIRSGQIDIGLYIATLHHLPSPQVRRTSLNEIARILVPGGSVLLSAWSVNHPKFDDRSPGDYFVPWTMPDGRTIDRYYHLFDTESLAVEIRQSDLRIERIWEADGNCWVHCTH